jgi:hypothetical protein
MEAEVAARVGAELGERAPAERSAQRNGYRARRSDTRIGEVEGRDPGAALGPDRALATLNSEHVTRAQPTSSNCTAHPPWDLCGPFPVLA